MDFKVAAISIGFIAAVAAVVSTLTELSLVGAIAIVAIAILLNGFVATIDGELPDGINNPDGVDSPTIVSRLAKLKSAVILVLLGLGLFAISTWIFDLDID